MRDRIIKTKVLSYKFGSTGSQNPHSESDFFSKQITERCPLGFLMFSVRVKVFRQCEIHGGFSQ